MSEIYDISILIPVRNGEKHLRETLQIVETIPRAEIIISNNFSTDGSIKTISEFKNVKVVNPSSSLTMIGNWNFTSKQGSSEYFKLVSHDDLVNTETIKSHLIALKSNPEAVFVFSPRDFLMETPKRKLKIKTPSIKFEKRISTSLELLKMVCQKGTNPVGETFCVTFRKSMMPMGDIWIDVEMIYELETYLRAIRIGPAILIPGKAGSFRVHTKSYSAGVADYFKLAKKVRAWVLFQPESSSLTKFDVISLHIMTRYVAIKKQFAFAILKRF